MKDLVLIIVAVVCSVEIVTSDKPPYRDALEEVEERLEERLLEKMVEAEDVANTETETQILGRLLQDLENNGQADVEAVEKKRLGAASAKFRPRPVCRPRVPYNPSSCCEPGFAYIDLTNGAPCTGIDTASGIELVEGPTDQTDTSEDCSKMALLKINFETFTKEPCDYCLRRPLCGKRMLRIDLELSPGTRSGFGFHIGDSRTNNGYTGDSGTQENDVEIEGTFPNVRVWASDKCDSQELKVFSNVIGSAVNSVTIYVSNQHMRIVNDQGFDEYLCNNCLYALNGQSDSEGPVNEDVYLGLNRIVQSTSMDRNGVGVCSATLSWACPSW